MDIVQYSFATLNNFAIPIHLVPNNLLHLRFATLNNFAIPIPSPTMSIMNFRFATLNNFAIPILKYLRIVVIDQFCYPK